MADWQPSNIVDFKNCSYVLVTKTATEATKSIIRYDRKLCDPQMCLNSWFIDVFGLRRSGSHFGASRSLHYYNVVFYSTCVLSQMLQSDWLPPSPSILWHIVSRASTRTIYGCKQKICVCIHTYIKIKSKQKFHFARISHNAIEILN